GSSSVRSVSGWGSAGMDSLRGRGRGRGGGKYYFIDDASIFPCCRRFGTAWRVGLLLHVSSIAPQGDIAWAVRFNDRNGPAIFSIGRRLRLLSLPVARHRRRL